MMNKKATPTFSTEFRPECAQLVLDQGYSVAKAAAAMNVGKSTIDKCDLIQYVDLPPELIHFPP